ncbi:SEC23-interacting protein [Bienertia sinuspersici]
MSERSRSGFTVTLGRSGRDMSNMEGIDMKALNIRGKGRVVKKAGGLTEERFHNDSSTAGSKRSIRDRLGRNSDDRHHPYNKRQRGEGFGTSNSYDTHLRKDDLRFKLMKKNTIRQSQNTDAHDNIDLRDKLLSKTSRSSVGSKTLHPSESTVTTRHPMAEPRNSGIIRHPMLEPRGTSILGQYPSSRNPSDLPIMEPGRPYTSWTLDNLRRRSPERLYQSSSRRGLSPERSREDLQRMPIRAYDGGRSSSCMRISPSRPVSSSPFLTRSSVPVGAVKCTVPLPPHYSQPSGKVHKIPPTGDEHPSVDSLLQSLGLEKYAIFFKAEEIDMKTLKQLGDNDLKDLGIPMGPRKKIIQSLIPRSRRLL